MKNTFTCILIMGVAGSGKTTIGSKLSSKINGFFIEADDFHGEHNINKMSEGIPLNDADRYDWLLKIKDQIISRIDKQNLVVACSALKDKYRQLIGVKKNEEKSVEVTARKLSTKRILAKQSLALPKLYYEIGTQNQYSIPVSLTQDEILKITDNRVYF